MSDFSLYVAFAYSPQKCEAHIRKKLVEMVNNVNGVFYATSYHPIQAGSIDGTDITAHDNGVYRALLASTTGLYDPLGDPNAKGDPYCSLFVGRLSTQTDEKSLHKAMSKFGRIKSLRLVRHIVTGASCGYAFVEFETEKEMYMAYEGAHLSKLDGASILVDYNRQQLMPGWIPRRLGGGLGGKKESGQLRFGGRDRPFRAPLRPIPHEELQKLGIPLPPEGHYMTRFQVPPLPQRMHSTTSEYDNRSKFSELRHHRVKDVGGREVNEHASNKGHGSESGEARERDWHRRRRVDHRDHDEAEQSRSYRKVMVEDRGQEEIPRESKYEGFEFESKRSNPKTFRDDQRTEDTHYGEEAIERKRRREPSHASHEYEEERRQNKRRQAEDSREHSAERSWRYDPQYRAKTNRSSDYHSEKSSEWREAESEQSRSRRDTERWDAHGRDLEPRNRWEEPSDHKKPSRHSEKKHRHSESTHQHRDRDQGYPEEDGIKRHRSHRKHKHRERSVEEKFDIEEMERRKSKDR